MWQSAIGILSNSSSACEDGMSEPETTSEKATASIVGQFLQNTCHPPSGLAQSWRRNPVNVYKESQLFPVSESPCPVIAYNVYCTPDPPHEVGGFAHLGRTRCYEGGVESVLARIENRRFKAWRI